MRTIIGMLAPLVLALAVTEAQDNSATKPRDGTEKVLLANERALHRAIAGADGTAFQSLVLSDGVWATNAGWVPMKLLGDGLGHFKLTRWDIVGPSVRWLDDDSAIVFDVWTGTGTFGDHPLAPKTLASTVWINRDGRWLAVHHQETDLTR